jgi:hypothetical protein
MKVYRIDGACVQPPPPHGNGTGDVEAAAGLGAAAPDRRGVSRNQGGADDSFFCARFCRGEKAIVKNANLSRLSITILRIHPGAYTGHPRSFPEKMDPGKQRTLGADPLF